MEGRAKAQASRSTRCCEAGRAATPARRFGTIDEFGATCAFLCSVHAGYIVGQNLLIDGGSYPGHVLTADIACDPWVQPDGRDRTSRLSRAHTRALRLARASRHAA